MSWIEKLYATYQNQPPVNIGNRSDKLPLLPVSHTRQNAHIEIALESTGNFRRAKIIQKAEAPTIIPATEESAGRTRGYVPHPLCDKLQYVAGDYAKFGGAKPSKFNEYLKNLEAWCSSSYTHPKILAVQAYVKKERVIADLVNAGILPIDSKGKLLKKRTEKPKETPEIFSVLPTPEDAFIRWSVEVPGDPQTELQSDKTVWKSWSDYSASQEATRGLCYVTGEVSPLATNHPKRIRYPGDSAKIISSNDTSGFTFLGRFTSAGEASGVSLEVTQKAHNALQWLIQRQGKLIGKQAIVAWAVSGADIPDPFSDTMTLLTGNRDSPPAIYTGYTAQEIGAQLSKLIAGYSVKLGPTEDVIVMALDSATPGRMAIRFYRELTGSDFLARVLSWHTDCSWRQNFSKSESFIGAPSPQDIAEAAYGRGIYQDNERNLLKTTTERLLPCIVDGVPVPRDIVESCVRRASSRNGVEIWEWEKALGIACGLYKSHQKERRYTLALDYGRKTRDYLYGRLLALAERLEGYALYKAGEQRDTNAARMMQRFADRPYSTWRTIETSLIPYKTRLRTKSPVFLVSIEREMDNIVNSFSPEDFLSDQRLSGEYLLGYHCQRAELWPKPDSESENS